VHSSPRCAARLPVKKHTSLYSIVLIAIGLLLIVGSFAYLFVVNKRAPKKLTIKTSDTLPPFFNPKSIKKRNPGDFTLRIPVISIEEHVYEGVDDETLKVGVGHYPGTAFPGEDGNIVMAAHSIATEEHPGPFTRVDELKTGDEITLIDKNSKQYVFTVIEQRIVESTDVSVLYPTKDTKITLISCIKPDYPRDKRLITSAVIKR